jgi:methylated-DNA-[protein]-cysteine S-methyltransferase
LTLFFDTLPTPVGVLSLEADETGLTAIHFPGRSPDEPKSSNTSDLLAEAARELQAYFEGRLTAFSVPLNWRGTPFQKTVWRALMDIPYGETVSYGEIAKAIGRPKSARPVGGAVGRNPLPIIVPCHRVIGSDQSLTGFTGGIDIKVALLKQEGLHLQ